jgi:tRNA threonylcarbamoyl adenosine modification protein YeaZ
LPCRAFHRAPGFIVRAIAHNNHFQFVGDGLQFQAFQRLFECGRPFMRWNYDGEWARHAYQYPSLPFMMYNSFMKTLFIDVASHVGMLALISDNSLTADTIDHRIDDAELVTRLEKFLESARTPYKDIERIACVVGPGGFTSLRVGVGFANALSGTLNIPSTGIHLSDLYAARSTGKDFLWLHSTKKNEVFARGFGSLKEKIPEATHFVLHDLEKLLIPGTLWTGELIPEQEKIVSDAGLKAMTLKPVEKVLPSFVDSLSYSQNTLLPWYGRGW